MVTQEIQDSAAVVVTADNLVLVIDDMNNTDTPTAYQ